LKVVLLAGGLGTRLAEETSTRPKPMVEIGGNPILWHIMKYYSSFGFHEFVVCLGYKGYVIKEYFANYFLHMSDVTFDLRDNALEVHQNHTEPWRVTLVDTGAETMTGGRIKRILPYVGNEPFLLTYGDGLSDVDLGAVIDLHMKQGATVTLTAVQPIGRFGAVTVSEHDWVTSFVEKPPGDSGFINGGFFVMDPSIDDYLAGDETVLEQDPLQRLASEGKLAAYRHSGFWHPMDTLRDRQQLEKLWASGSAPWKRWEL
jgi:glucose-1-phosphate cytidylyltransferase